MASDPKKPARVMGGVLQVGDRLLTKLAEEAVQGAENTAKAVAAAKAERAQTLARGNVEGERSLAFLDLAPLRAAVIPPPTPAAGEGGNDGS